MKRSIAAIVLLVQSGMGASLQDYRAAHSQEVMRVESTYHESLTRLRQAYGAGVSNLAERAKAAGDLDTYLTAYGEVRRFASLPVFPAVVKSTWPEAMRALNQRAIVSGEALAITRDRETVAAGRVYVSRLESRMRQLTREGRLQEAIDFRREAVRVQFEIASLESRLPKDTPDEPLPAPRVKYLSPHALGSVEFRGHHYKLFEDKVTWHDAKKRCEDMGGHLVTITSEEENAAVYAAFPSARESWIGLTDEKAKRAWGWVTGEPMRFLNWGYHQPHQRSGEDYGAFCTPTPTDSGRWADRQGTDRLPFICEWDR